MTETQIIILLIFLIVLLVYVPWILIRYYPELLMKLLDSLLSKKKDEAKTNTPEEPHSFIQVHDYGKRKHSEVSELKSSNPPNNKNTFDSENVGEETHDVDTEYEEDDRESIDENEEFIPCEVKEEIADTSQFCDFEKLIEVHNAATNDSASGEIKKRAYETIKTIEGTSIFEAMVHETPQYLDFVRAMMDKGSGSSDVDIEELYVKTENN